MTSPPTYPYEKNDLRAFIRSTSLSTTQLAYIPPTDSQMTLPLEPSKSATFSRRSPSPYPRPAPLRRTASFANLLNVFRRPSLSFSAESLSTRGNDSIDLDERRITVDPHITYPMAGKRATAPPCAAVPPRSSSLAWLNDAPKEDPGREDARSVFTLQLYMDGEDELELEVAAELRETFREWEERFGLRQSDEEPIDPLSPTIATSPTSPATTHLLTPAPTLYNSLNPLRSTFSCDSDDDERAAVLEVVRGRDDHHTASPGSIGRLTRKMSSAITFGIAQKSPLGKRLGQGRRDTT